jgi:hypothetical protein
VPTVTDRLPERIEGAVEEILALDWRLHDIVVMPVTRLEDLPVGEKGGGSLRRAASSVWRGGLPRAERPAYRVTACSLTPSAAAICCHDHPAPWRCPTGARGAGRRAAAGRRRPDGRSLVSGFQVVGARRRAVPDGAWPSCAGAGS